MSGTKWMRLSWVGCVCALLGCSTTPQIPSQVERSPRLVLEGDPTGPSLFEECSRNKQMGGVSLACGGGYEVVVRFLITNGGASQVFDDIETPLGTRRVSIALKDHDAPGFQYKQEVSGEGTGGQTMYRRGLQMVIPQDDEDEVAFVYTCERLQSDPGLREDDMCLDYLVSAQAMPVKVLAGEE